VNECFVPEIRDDFALLNEQKKILRTIMLSNIGTVTK